MRQSSYIYNFILYILHRQSYSSSCSLLFFLIPNVAIPKLGLSYVIKPNSANTLAASVASRRCASSSFSCQVATVSPSRSNGLVIVDSDIYRPPRLRNLPFLTPKICLTRFNSSCTRRFSWRKASVPPTHLAIWWSAYLFFSANIPLA